MVLYLLGLTTFVYVDQPSIGVVLGFIGCKMILDFSGAYFLNTINFISLYTKNVITLSYMFNYESLALTRLCLQVITYQLRFL